MFRKKLHFELGNFFYAISGIGDNISIEEKIAMQESITEVWEYFSKPPDSYSINTGISIKLSFGPGEDNCFNENSFKSFEQFYLSNKSLFTPEIIMNIMLTSKAIAQSYYDNNEDDTTVLNQFENIFLK